jgi:hypothetical protein
MAFKLPDKKQVNFARSVFRDVLKELQKQRDYLGNESKVLPELTEAVTKPGVDPRNLALDLIRTGRLPSGKKLSSNQRRKVAYTNDFINQAIPASEDIGLALSYYPIKDPFIPMRIKEKRVRDALIDSRSARKIDYLLRNYQDKLTQGTLTPQDLINVEALNTMKMMRNIEAGNSTPFNTIKGVASKFDNLKNKQYTGSDFLSFDVVKNPPAVLRKLRKASGIQDFIDKASGWKIAEVLRQLDESGIQRNDKIDEMIIALLPDWNGLPSDFVDLLKSLGVTG